MPLDPFRLDDRLAMVTGGGTGIGLGVARALAMAGARVIVVGRHRESLDAAATEIGERAHAVVHDVTDHARAPALAAAILRDHGPVDCLVNSAGVHLKKPALETNPADLQRLLDVHVIGAHALVQAFAPTMVQRRSGVILFIASMASLFGIPQVLAYSAAKSAHLGMVRTLATELSPRGVRVNAIAPGWIETPMSRQAMQGDPEREHRILERCPMGCFGSVEDVGSAAVYLCSEAARFVTGVVLPVDGGVSIGF